MKNAENEKSYSDKIKSVVSKTDLKKIEKSEKVKFDAEQKLLAEISENAIIDKTAISDDDLIADLEAINVSTLINKTATNRNIWKATYKSSISENEKTARRKIRALQLKYSKAVLHSIITKMERSEQIKRAKELHSFYVTGLENFENFSNVSENENPDKFAVIHKAYQKMNLLIK